ncbi:MAG TPA: glycosyltransferase [Patescibacteria group bacterium]|nr:glycosyltransferase [Patescibacteria group bacterium]
MNKKLSGVTAMIPSFNCKKNLFRTLDFLLKSNYPNLEIIVIDNGSTDGTWQEGKKKYKKVKWIDAGAINIGQTGCYNLGFAHANPKNHVMMVDSDVVVDKDMVTNLVSRLESKPKIGVVTPMVLYLNDENWVNQAGSTVNLWTGKVTIGWGDRKNFLKAKEVQGSGTVMIFKRKLIETIGGFEDWFLCYFDPEYSVRGKKAGFSTWYEPEAICYHDQDKDEDYWRPRVMSRAFLLGKNRTLFMRKHGKNILVYILFTPLLFAYYLREAIRYNLMNKWYELIQGTIAGFFYPLDQRVKLPLPVIDPR